MVKTKRLITAPFFALLFAQILWGVNTPVIKLGLRTVPLYLYLGITILGAALAVLPFALRKWKHMARRDLMLLTIGSLIAITLGNVTLLMGLQRVLAVNASLIGLFSPMLLFILSVEFLREKLNLRTFIGILISFLGAAIVIGNPWGAKTGANQQILIGNLLLVLTVLCEVTGTLIFKSVLRRNNSYQVTFLHLLIGILPIVIYSLPTLGALSLSRATRTGYIAIVFNIFAVAAANMLFMYGLKKRKAQEVGIFTYVHPLAAGVAAWLILSEVPDGKLIIGAILIFVGIYYAEIKNINNYKRSRLRLSSR